MKHPGYFLLSIAMLVFLFSCGQHKETDHHQHSESQESEDYKLHLDAPIFSGSSNGASSSSPFSEIVQTGDLYFLSGKIGRNPETGKLAVGGIEAETRQTLENIKKVLEDNGLEMTDVVKAMVVLDDIEDFSAFNTIYMEYFPQKPARTTFAAEALALGAKIEIEVMAVKKSFDAE